ncbi:lasso peptide biosynthesis B2 protein [Scopulibacillus darangshiensis]
MNFVCNRLKKVKSRIKFKDSICDIKPIYEMCDVVNTACDKHPLKEKAKCLHQSIISFYILVKRGVPVNLCIGVSTDIFLAHAWVELSGKVINDKDSVKNNYKLIYKV